MAATSPAAAAGPAGVADTRLPQVALRLGDVALTCSTEGAWTVHSATLHQYATKDSVREVAQAIQAARDELRQLEGKYEDALQAKAELLAKNNVLEDMIAEADLECEALNEALAKERTKVEALKWHMAGMQLRGTR